MVALADFCKDRRREIERKEKELARQEAEKGYSRNENLIKDIVLGTQSIKEEREKAKQDFKAFCEFFPYLPEQYSPVVLWKAWGGNKDALREIYGESIPPEDFAEKDIGSFLCQYNLVKSMKK